MFEVQAASLSPLDRIVIGHDDSGSASGWKLEKVGPYSLVFSLKHVTGNKKCKILSFLHRNVGDCVIVFSTL